jgi:hypothetical protein
VSGVSFSHLLQRGPNATLSGVQFLAVQQVLLRNYGRMIGGLEIAALFSTLAMAIVTWGNPVVPLLATLASAFIFSPFTFLVLLRFLRFADWDLAATERIFPAAGGKGLAFASCQSALCVLVLTWQQHPQNLQ